MAKMKGVSLKYRRKRLSSSMHYAHEIYHRTDMSLFTDTIKAFTSVSDTLEQFTETISIGSQSPGKAHYLATSRALSQATAYLCRDLKYVTRSFQDIRSTYDALYGHQKKYLWNLLDRFVAEIGFVIEKLLQIVPIPATSCGGNDGIDRVRTSRHRVTNDQLAGNQMALNRLLLSSFIHHTVGAGILPLTTFTLLTFLTINQTIQISVCLYLTVNHTITT